MLPFFDCQSPLAIPVSCVQALSDADSKVSLIFKHQLMQLNNVSEHMAAAVVSVYPSPAHLLNVSDVQWNPKHCYIELTFLLKSCFVHIRPGSSGLIIAVLQYYLFFILYFLNPSMYYYQ